MSQDWQEIAKDYCEDYCSSKCYDYTGQEWLDCNSSGINCTCSKGFSEIAVIFGPILAAIFILVLIIFIYVIRKRRQKRNAETVKPQVTTSASTVSSQNDHTYVNVAEPIQNNPMYQYQIQPGIYSVTWKSTFS